jgi:asparagine N-glycosylation enzyme membrane subunit Stt3
MDLKQKAKEYKESLDKETITKTATEKWHLGALAAIVATAFMLRYMPEKGMQYLQAADPYFIFRNSQQIALQGNLPQIDFHRYFAYTSPTYLYKSGAFLIPALLWKAGFSLLFTNYLEWAQFYPAMMGAGSVLVMYFLGKELFNKKTGLSAAFFLAVTSAALRRTSAGFFEKEPIGTFLMMTSLLFYTKAWKQKDWKNGILSGLSLGLFTISWGGSQLLWLLYPIITGATLFINEDTRNLITSYTPTILIGGLFAAIVEPSNFWFTSSLFIFATAVLGALWARYLVEEFELVAENYLPYFIPSMSVLGLIAAIISPLYSSWIARKILSVIQKALGSTGGVIGGTVQENAAPGAAALIRDLGSVLTSSTNPAIQTAAAATTPWLLMIASTSILITSLLLMLGRKYSILDKEIDGKSYISYLQVVFIAVLAAASGLVINAITISVFAAIIIGASLIALIYFLDSDSSLTISSMALIGAVAAALVFALRFSGGIFTPASYLIFFPAAAAALASALLHYFQSFPEKEIQFKWHMIIPLMWIGASTFGATTRSRLVFLSSFAIALGAGHGLATTLQKLREFDYQTPWNLNSENLKIGILAFALVAVVGLNVFSGYAMSQGIRGSPSPSPEVWEPSLDYMQNETPEGSVILSWWDYGYLFEELGDRAAIADGMNAGYYSQETRAVNMPLARYLNTTDSQTDREFLEKHSADYIWLDHTMIGKFSAVSQIANKNNSQFETIGQIATPGSFQNSVSSDGNQTVVEFNGRLGRSSIQVFAPIQRTNTSLSLEGSPTVRVRGGQTANIGCVLTEEGKETFDVENDIGYCIAEDPFYSMERGAAGGQARALLVPKKISESTFVKLYIQDGYGLDYAEKIPEASNGYIKMWKVEQ